MLPHQFPRPRVAITGDILENIKTGFAEVTEWEFKPEVHPMIPAWFGRHLRSQAGPPHSSLPS